MIPEIFFPIMGREVGRKDLSTQFPGISAQTWHSTLAQSAEKTTRTICIILFLSILPTIRALPKNAQCDLGDSQGHQKIEFPKFGGEFCGDQHARCQWGMLRTVSRQENRILGKALVLWGSVSNLWIFVKTSHSAGGVTTLHEPTWEISRQFCQKCSETTRNHPLGWISAESIR